MILVIGDISLDTFQLGLALIKKQNRAVATYINIDLIILLV